MRSSPEPARIAVVAGAWRDGFGRVCAAPALVGGVYALTLLVAAPLALTVRAQIQAHLGASLAAEEMASGVNPGWWQEFTHDTAGPAGSGLGFTFTPAIIGAGAALDSVNAVLETAPRPPLLLATAGLYLLGWLLLAGGIVDQYARPGPRARAGTKTRAGFFTTCRATGLRCVRLGIVAACGYGLILGVFRPWLFAAVYLPATRALASEPAVFAWRLGMYTLLVTALVSINIVIDYARIRLVVEDRRSVSGAILAAAAFLTRHPGTAVGLYASNALTFIAAAGTWLLVAPGVGTGSGRWLALGAAQLWLLARLVLKLQFVASAVALFEERLG